LGIGEQPALRLAACGKKLVFNRVEDGIYFIVERPDIRWLVAVQAVGQGAKLPLLGLGKNFEKWHVAKVGLATGPATRCYEPALLLLNLPGCA
jgi:hypothetical protein